jgi:hypothetical protein
VEAVRHEHEAGQAQLEIAWRRADQAELQFQQCRKDLEVLEHEQVAVVEQQAEYFEATLNAHKQQLADILQCAQVQTGNSTMCVLTSQRQLSLLMILKSLRKKKVDATIR